MQSTFTIAILATAIAALAVNVDAAPTPQLPALNGLNLGKAGLANGGLNGLQLGQVSGIINGILNKGQPASTTNKTTQKHKSASRTRAATSKIGQKLNK